MKIIGDSIDQILVLFEIATLSYFCCMTCLLHECYNVCATVCPKKFKQIGISIDAATVESSTVELCVYLGIGKSIVKALLKN